MVGDTFSVAWCQPVGFMQVGEVRGESSHPLVLRVALSGYTSLYTLPCINCLVGVLAVFLDS